jgi:hypothetical protein
MSRQAGTASARRPAVAGAALVIAAGLIAAGCSSSSSSPGTLAGPVWLCQPGQAADPCAADLAATTVTAGGALKPATWPHSAMASKFDCFYVHPTDSLAQAANAGLTKVPLCTAGTQTGCAIAFSSYPSQPPPDSVFGRPGQGTSLQSGQTAKAGQQVACVNPAALAGGTGDLDPYLLTATQTTQSPIDSGRLTEPVSTPWVSYPGLYSASCDQGGGATWLQVTSLAGTSRTRPVVNDDTEGQLGGTGPAWGYHGYEYWLTLGNLFQDITGEEAAWQSRH